MYRIAILLDSFYTQYLVALHIIIVSIPLYIIMKYELFALICLYS